MIYVTGDTHAMQDKWMQQIEPVLSPGDTLLVCGDFGVGFWSERNRSEEAFYDHLSGQPYTVLFIDGNHENFAQLNRYPVEAWCGGRVHTLRPNVRHLMRGEVFSIEGKTIFTMGGGHSLDQYRRKAGVSWWPEEMPSQAEYDAARANLARVGHRVDYVITHTAPSESIYYLSTLRALGIRSVVPEELPLTTFLDEVQRDVTYRHWYFGHLHVDVELWRDQTALLSTIRTLEGGEIVRQWESYEG
jgi:hypothetical protein